ncbi:MAG TPA: cytochrome c [Candidatus Baltobacteraceae bacterium]|nr:cytochrome c [Candidatus Baltobacteraceae bacterium]
MKTLRALGLLSLPAFVLFALANVRAGASGVPTVHDEPHMEMTLQASERPGDRARADAILSAARQVMAAYPTVADAERAGFTKFLPGVPLPIEHYTSRAYALEAWFGHFDALHPTSLIFKRTTGGLQIVGVMYTASNQVDRDGLDARVPLSFGTWHRHIDFCKPPAGTPRSDLFPPNARFGLAGSITTLQDCEAAGGTFLPVVFGWMVHVWPNETAREKIWAVDMHGDAHHHAEGMVGTFSAGLPIPAAKLPAAPVGAGDPARGALVFSENCQSCHGAAGRAGPDAPALAASGLSAGQVAFMIRHPQAIDAASAMPLISLGDRDVADVAAYVAGLK